MLYIDHDKFDSLAEDLFNACKVKIILYNEKGELLYKSKFLNPLCSELWKSPTLHKRCLESNKKGMDMCRENGCTHIYSCHIGLREVVTPIELNNVTIGYLMFGQIADETVDLQKLREVLVEKAKAHNLDTGVLLNSVDLMNSRTTREINSIATLMDMCYGYMLLNNIIQVREATVSHLLKNYIADNISGDLSIPTICTDLGISKSKLYNISRETFNCGISYYVLSVRINKAKELLCDSNLSISDIALAVGISDYSYFTKVFKRVVGMVPKEYRKQNRN